MKREFSEIRHAFEHLLYQIHGTRRLIEAIQEQPAGAQGASGSRIRYFNVTSTDPQGVAHHDRLVTKAASLLERRVLELLSNQGCAVPPVFIPDVTSEGRASIYMPYLEARPPLDLGHPFGPLTRSIAEGLAGIHASNRQQPPPCSLTPVRIFWGGCGCMLGVSSGKRTWRSPISPPNLGLILPGSKPPWRALWTS